ncbi:MAG TPA: DUF971 domain-containing protein [candidate division Zixibacteria bacterium]|nr:DUF971 domain-containing protein [candidate division Zixibacteria bacterium]
MESRFPVEIHHQKAAGAVRIIWDDGHSADYPQDYLRGYCPCALCQGHGPAIRFRPVEGARLETIRAVGNYAVEFVWSDGHSTGIYSYDYLRSICPCSICRGAGG